MDQLTWLALGAFAMLWSLLVFRRDVDVVYGSLIATLAWVFWGYSATAVEIYGDSGRIATESYPALALLFGGGMAVIMLVTMLKGTIVMAGDQPQPTPERDPPRAP